MRNLATFLFTGGLGFMLLSLASGLEFGSPPMLAGSGVQTAAADEVGAANFVTAVVLGYRGIDTLGELSILFAASAAAGLALGRKKSRIKPQADGGFVLRTGADLLFPLLLAVGFYIIFHGHLSPGGGFQGGVILAAAFFVPLLARPSSSLNHASLSLVEGLAGASFILIGLWALLQGGEFLQPFLSKGVIGDLVSAGTLPLLYLAVGLKVGAELAGLLSNLSEAEAVE